MLAAASFARSARLVRQVESRLAALVRGAPVKPARRAPVVCRSTPYPSPGFSNGYATTAIVEPPSPPSTPQVQDQVQPPAAVGEVGRLSMEDRLELMDLCNRFDELLNKQQQHVLGDLMSPDVEVHHPKGVAQGVDACVGFFVACRPLSVGNRHLTLNLVLQPGPTTPGGARTAHASAYRLLHRATTPPVLVASGRIDDEFVWSEERGRWLFWRRRLEMDPPAVAVDGRAAALAQQ